MCGEVCTDNRFEIIKKAKEYILENTNISSREDQMKVLDSFLFRCWQMGWLDRFDATKSPWKKCKDELPPEGVEVIAYHHKWIDEDFNPNGTRVGFLNGDGEFTSAYWWDYQDCYQTINKSNCEDNKDFFKSHIDNTEPEYWCYVPELPKE